MELKLKEDQVKSNIEMFKEEITALEKVLRESNNDRVTFDRQSPEFPLKHTITDGVYVRQMTMKKGSFVLGAVHKRDHRNNRCAQVRKVNDTIPANRPPDRGRG